MLLGLTKSWGDTYLVHELVAVGPEEQLAGLSMDPALSTAEVVAGVEIGVT